MTLSFFLLYIIMQTLNNPVVLTVLRCFNVHKSDFFHITLYLDAHSGFHVYSILLFDIVFVLGVFGSNGNVIKEAESHGLRAFCMVSRGPGNPFKNFFRLKKAIVFCMFEKMSLFSKCVVSRKSFV